MEVLASKPGVAELDVLVALLYGPFSQDTKRHTHLFLSPPVFEFKIQKVPNQFTSGTSVHVHKRNVRWQSSSCGKHHSRYQNARLTRPIALNLVQEYCLSSGLQTSSELQLATAATATIGLLLLLDIQARPQNDKWSKQGHLNSLGETNLGLQDGRYWHVEQAASPLNDILNPPPGVYILCYFHVFILYKKLPF